MTLLRRGQHENSTRSLNLTDLSIGQYGLFLGSIRCQTISDEKNRSQSVEITQKIVTSINEYMYFKMKKGLSLLETKILQRNLADIRLNVSTSNSRAKINCKIRNLIIFPNV